MLHINHNFYYEMKNLPYELYLYIYIYIESHERNMHRSDGSQGDRSEQT